MEEHIENSSSTTMTDELANLQVNTCFISKIYFGCGIIGTTEAQDKELRRIYEKLLTGKLDIKRNFQRKFLHGRATAIGIGTMLPKNQLQN